MYAKRQNNDFRTNNARHGFWTSGLLYIFQQIINPINPPKIPNNEPNNKSDGKTLFYGSSKEGSISKF
jgi:hypothetical protein